MTTYELYKRNPVESFAADPAAGGAGGTRLGGSWSSEEAAYRRLREGCGRNRELLRQVAELADAEAALAESAGEYQFFLGLQMGLELGAMDLLGDEEDDVWEQLEFSS